jgi:hypothetical protein
MRYVQTFESFLNEKSSGEIFNPVRNKAITFDPKKHPELADEFYELISIAYAEIGGHVKVKTPKDVFSDPDWNYWEGVDIHNDNNFDIIIFGEKTKHGIKYSGVGHDGDAASKRKYLEMRGTELKKLGHYIEVSGKIAEILMNKYNVPVVDDAELVAKILGKPINWIGTKNNASGDGWYSRTIGGHVHDKIMLGRPKK